MKTLVLVRHAKSSWGDDTLSDHDRPLDDRGLRDAPQMGRMLQLRGIRPDVLLTSSAVRARTTAELIAHELGDMAVTVDEDLYASTPDTILGRVAEIDGGAEVVMVVAHDPGMSALAAQFSDLIEAMPTAAVAQLEFEVESWGELAGARPVRVVFDTPKTL